ncbi:bifunctional L-alanine/L-glutamate racemase [soil metagenome]
MEISEIITSLGEERELYQNAVAPPIMQTSNFCFNTVEDMRRGLQRESEEPFYTRGLNPTTEMLRKKMAALEKTEDALVFASGSAAVAAAIMSQVGQGDHVVCVQKPYSWTNKLLNLLLPRFGVEATMVDGKEVFNYKSAIKSNTKILYMESPNSWTFELQDIEQVVKIAKDHELITIIDNSYATPLNMTPADYGVDMMIHSATKYISGHSDALGGIVCSSKKIIRQIFHGEFMTLGGTISPYNSWLLLRGLRTLPIRMQRVAETTEKVVSYLEQNDKVGKIYYPFLKTNPQYELARKQMKKGAGQFTIQLKTREPAKIEAFCNHLKHFLLACSWGGYESLIFPAITLYQSQNYKTGDLDINMIRFYIGLEDADFLIEDLEKAFEQI